MSSNPLTISNSTIDRVKETLKTVTDAALFVEELLGGMGVGANPAELERLTEAFGNLAAIAIQAAHSVAGQAVTPESVLALLPVNTPLAPPAA
ncbi:MAG TPA: hypothetical protein VFR84_15250 [Candidatus Angelobacter sp.]|nr:hypothetical protein [Candidatus Angelobacter sp.]